MSAPPFRYCRGDLPLRRPPPPVLRLTPDFVPAQHFVIPRSPSLFSSASEAEEEEILDSWIPPPRSPTSQQRLRIPSNHTLRSRSLSCSPSSMTRPSLPQPPPSSPRGGSISSWTNEDRKASFDYLHHYEPPEAHSWSERRDERRPSTIACNLPSNAERRRLPRTPDLGRQSRPSAQLPLEPRASSSGRRLPSLPFGTSQTQLQQDPSSPNLSPLPTPVQTQFEPQSYPQVITHPPDDTPPTGPADNVSELPSPASSPPITTKEPDLPNPNEVDIPDSPPDVRPPLSAAPVPTIQPVRSPSPAPVRPNNAAKKMGAESESKSSSDTEEPRVATSSPAHSCVETGRGKSGSLLEVAGATRGRSASTVTPITDSFLTEERRIYVEDRPSSADSDSKNRGLGKLHFCIQFFPVRKRLRVSVLKAVALGGQLRPDLELAALVKICLMPGKMHKQRSSVAKRNRDAVFNEEFFFDNITNDEIRCKSVNIRVCHHRAGQFHKDLLIGEVEIPLLSVPELQSKKEIHLQRVLKPKFNAKKLGKVQITTSLEVERKCMTINVIKAEDLPKLGLSGNPDPCVRITVVQPGKVQRKQTRTLKGTRSAVYKEAVMFLIDTKDEALEGMDVLISVVDTVRSASGVDDILGEAYLGISAQDKSEQDQWRNMRAHPGKDFKATHLLKPSRASQLH